MTPQKLTKKPETKLDEVGTKPRAGSAAEDIRTTFAGQDGETAVGDAAFEIAGDEADEEQRRTAADAFTTAALVNDAKNKFRRANAPSTAASAAVAPAAATPAKPDEGDGDVVVIAKTEPEVGFLGSVMRIFSGDASAEPAPVSSPKPAPSPVVSPTKLVSSQMTATLGEEDDEEEPASQSHTIAPETGHVVDFAMTLADLSLDKFDAAMRATFTAGLAKALQLAPSQVQITSVTAGSVVVGTRVIGLPDAKATAALASRIVSDSATLVDAKVFGRVEIKSSDVKVVYVPPPAAAADAAVAAAAADAAAPAVEPMVAVKPPAKVYRDVADFLESNGLRQFLALLLAKGIDTVGELHGCTDDFLIGAVGMKPAHVIKFRRALAELARPKEGDDNLSVYEAADGFRGTHAEVLAHERATLKHIYRFKLYECTSDGFRGSYEEVQAHENELKAKAKVGTLALYEAPDGYRGTFDEVQAHELELGSLMNLYEAPDGYRGTYEEVLAHEKAMGLRAEGAEPLFMLYECTSDGFRGTYDEVLAHEKAMGLVPGDDSTPRDGEAALYNLYEAPDGFRGTYDEVLAHEMKMGVSKEGDDVLFRLYEAFDGYRGTYEDVFAHEQKTRTTSRFALYEVRRGSIAATPVLSSFAWLHRDDTSFLVTFPPLPDAATRMPMSPAGTRRLPWLV